MYYTYILASSRNGTLYIGVTSNLKKRTMQHRQDNVNAFTSKYWIHHLVYFEAFREISVAIQREKQLKRWNREWKLALIEKENSSWKDLTNLLI